MIMAQFCESLTWCQSSNSWLDDTFKDFLDLLSASCFTFSS